MATRYWVGGAGTWDSTSTTNWSTTSGGAGGASAPTYADNVIFDSASNATAYTVTFAQGFIGTGSISGTVLTITAVTSGILSVGATITRNPSTPVQPTDATYVIGGTYITSFGTGTGGIGTYNVNISQTNASQVLSAMPSCLDVTVSAPLSGILTVAGQSNTKPSFYGSMTLAAANVTWSSVSEVIFCAKTTGKTITTNGVSFGTGSTGCITFDGIGGGWTLGSALTTGFTSTTLTLRVNRGDFSTGNFAITTTNFQSLGTNTRSISLGSSAVTLSGTAPVNFTATGLTFAAGTSTITISNATSTFTGGGLTYYNVTFSNAGVSTKAITGANTFNNLTFAGRTATGEDVVTFSANQTVNSILSLQATGTVTASRRFFKSDVLGTQRTITTPSAATFVYCDFQDIVISGAASPISGTRLGNVGNNSGITFPASKTVYWSLAAGGTWGSTTSSWAATSGGAAADANFPLVQDTAIIQDTGLTSGNTITASNHLLGQTDFSTRTLPMTWTINTSTAQFYGPLFLSSAVTITGQTIRTGTATGIAYASGTSVGIHPSVSLDIPNVSIDIVGNTVAVYTGSLVNVPSAIAYLQSSVPSVFTGYSALLASGNISFSAPSPSVSTVANLNVPSGNLGIYSWMPSVYTGYTAKLNFSETNVTSLVPSVRTGVKLTIPNSVTYVSGVAPRGVGIISKRRIVFVTGDTSTNVVLIETDNSTQLNTTINGVVLNDLYNQTI